MLCLCSCSSLGWACQGPKHVEDGSVTYMLLLNCALKLFEEIILYISMYARTKRCYNERGSRTNYVRSSISHCTLIGRVLSRTFQESYSPICFLLVRYYSQIHILPQKFTGPLLQLYRSLSANHPKTLRFMCHIIKHSTHARAHTHTHTHTHTLYVKKNGTKRLSLMLHANKLFLCLFQNKGLVAYLHSHLPRLALSAGCTE